MLPHGFCGFLCGVAADGLKCLVDGSTWSTGARVRSHIHLYFLQPGSTPCGVSPLPLPASRQRRILCADASLVDPRFARCLTPCLPGGRTPPPRRANFFLRLRKLRAPTTGLPSHPHSATSGKWQTLDGVCGRAFFSLPSPPWRTSGTTLTTCSRWGPLRTSRSSRHLFCRRGGSNGSRLELLPRRWWDQVAHLGCSFVVCLGWLPGDIRDNALSPGALGCGKVSYRVFGCYARHHKRSPNRPSAPSRSICRAARGKPDKVRAGIAEALVPGHELPGVDRRAGGVLLFARGAAQAVLRSHGDVPRAGVFPHYFPVKRCRLYFSNRRVDGCLYAAYVACCTSFPEPFVSIFTRGFAIIAVTPSSARR